MNNTNKTFQVATRNIELEIAQKNIELLREYVLAKNDADKAKIYEQMDDMVQSLLSRNHTPEDLITGLEKAIKLYDFKPKNMSIFMLAVSDKLDYIGGEFNTFDSKLSKLSKDIEKNAPKIRNEFNGSTVNRFVLSKQFANDWLSRLKQHKDLTDKVRNVQEDMQLVAYDELFQALAKDFCKEYDIPEEVIGVKVVKNWGDSDFKPSYEKMTAVKTECWGLSIPDHLSTEEENKILENFHKSPQTCPGAFRRQIVRVNFDLIMAEAVEHGIEPFALMCAIFGHEMNHVLDHIKPREGALGPQVAQLDKKTYKSAGTDMTDYYKSATERSSYEITREMVNLLNSFWRE